MSEKRYPARMTARRRVALIGVAAILFQAILFGWHHHALALATHGGSIASVYNALQEMPAAVAEGSCEICAVLYHQNASPPGCTAPPTPSATASSIYLPAPVFPGRTAASGFHARAPPAIESAT